MLITKHLGSVARRHPRSIIAFGVFDGLHRGHQALIRELVARARRVGANSVVVTFDPHPQLVLRHKRWPMILTPLPEKEALLAALGVDILGVIRFSRATARMAPAAFVDRVLVRTLAATEVVCGSDCGFGRGRGGDLALLRELGRRRGFKVDQLRPRLHRGAKVSSTAIRRALLAGDLAEANTMLGRPYRMQGRVVAGFRLGRTLGYPTANIRLGDASKLVPADGVYAAVAAIGPQRYHGMLYIGSRPTFYGKRRQIEFHAFGARGRLTGRDITVDVLKFMRPDRRFANPLQLREAITADERAIRRFLVHRPGH